MSVAISKVRLEDCKPYNDVFSPATNVQAVKDAARKIQIQVKRKTEACKSKNALLQEGSRSPFLRNGENIDVVIKTEPLSAEDVQRYTTAEGIVELNKDGIEMALDRRVALFFHQAILCYGMSAFTFSAEGADLQIGSATKMELSSEDGAHSVTHTRAAAHSSTIPALLACAKDGSTDKFVYLKGGSGYYQHNATIGMHNCINKTDSLLDGKENEDGSLRQTTIALINRLAQKELSPVEATQEFMRAFCDRTISVKTRLLANDKRRTVLDIYKRNMEAIEKASADPVFYNRLLGVVIDPDDKDEALLREVIYKKRFDVIRKQEIVESAIGKSIDTLKEAMTVKTRAYLEHVLLSSFANPSENTILKKLLCKTTAGLEEPGAVSADKKKFKAELESVERTYKTQIQNLQRDLREKFRELNCTEFSYRAGLFKDLRSARQWTQVRFVQEYAEKTGSTISQPWVSRMEQLSRVDVRASYETPLNQRRRLVSIQDAERCAITFEIDKGLFFPCLFTSGG